MISNKKEKSNWIKIILFDIRLYMKEIIIFLMVVFIMTNQLSKSDSPYLLAHADNPVDWYEWSDEAFKRARKENKLIFLSIGYSTCHWCHVMEKESFKNREIAEGKPGGN